MAPRDGKVSDGHGGVANLSGAGSSASIVRPLRPLRDRARDLRSSLLDLHHLQVHLCLSRRLSTTFLPRPSLPSPPHKSPTRDSSPVVQIALLPSRDPQMGAIQTWLKDCSPDSCFTRRQHKNLHEDSAKYQNARFPYSFKDSSYHSPSLNSLSHTMPSCS